MRSHPDSPAIRENTYSPENVSSAAPGVEAAGRAGIDCAASAALALAVASGKKAAQDKSRRDNKAKKSLQALLRFAPPFKEVRPYYAHAFVGLVALSAGWLLAGSRVSEDVSPAEAAWSAAAESLRHNQEDVNRLTGDVKALRTAVQALRESVDRARTDSGLKQNQLMERVTRSDQSPPALTKTLAGLTDQINRMEASAKDRAPQFTALNERLDRLEGQVAAALAQLPAKTASIAPPADIPIQTGSIDTKSAAKEAVVEGWVLREVSGGVALIEGRNRRLVEVGPGDTVPGLGRVEAIERRGKRWAVITPKGVIAPR